MENEKRLIDANVLKVLFDVRYDTAFIQERTRENKDQWNGYCTGINWGRNTIASAPTVDAVEVVHAEWLDGSGMSRDGSIVYESIDCSHCKEVFKIESETREYWKDRFGVCPFCGAVMDGGNEDGSAQV